MKKKKKEKWRKVITFVISKSIHETGNSRRQSFRLFEELVNRGLAFDEAIEAAIPNMRDENEDIRESAMQLFDALIEEKLRIEESSGYNYRSSSDDDKIQKIAAFLQEKNFQEPNFFAMFFFIRSYVHEKSVGRGLPYEIHPRHHDSIRKMANILLLCPNKTAEFLWDFPTFLHGLSEYSESEKKDYFSKKIKSLFETTDNFEKIQYLLLLPELENIVAETKSDSEDIKGYAIKIVREIIQDKKIRTAFIKDCKSQLLEIDESNFDEKKELLERFSDFLSEIPVFSDEKDIVKDFQKDLKKSLARTCDLRKRARKKRKRARSDDDKPTSILERVFRKRR